MQGSHTVNGRPRLWVAAFVVALGTLAIGASLPAAASAGRPPLGKYVCYYPGTPGSFHPLKLVSRTKYTVDGGRKTRYRYANGKIKFKKGAYSDYYGRYESANKQIVIYDRATNFRLWNCQRPRR